MAFPKNIFLADDDCDDVDLFTIALKEINPESQLTVARDGFELVDNLRKAAAIPDIIFLDINMPRMDGIRTLRAIRNEIPAGKDLPVIIYSTTDDELFISNAYNEGANCYFKKPFSFSELKACINNLLQADWKKTILPYDQFAVVV